VIGGGDAAVEEALYLARFASEVLLIHRRDTLRAATYLQNRFFAGPNVKFIGETVVQEFRGEKKLESILMQNVADKSVKEIDVEGAFLFVGRIPATGFIEGIEKDDQGFIKTGEEMETSIPGVFAAGDVRSKLLRQVVTAAADGAIAATKALKYIELGAAESL
jgi:thioredoxin reductase (NADPH)